MTPWVELGPADTPQGWKREMYINLAVQGIENLVDPQADDFGNFDSVAREPVVHGAIFALCARPSAASHQRRAALSVGLLQQLRR